MHPLVRDLYKRFMVVARDYPGGAGAVRARVKEGFWKNRDIADDVELKQAIAYGRYQVREMVALVQLKKYRAMKKRYE